MEEVKEQPKFVLGPNQEAWVQMLETTCLPQDKRKLCKCKLYSNKQDKQDDVGYCCLGIGGKVLGKTDDQMINLAGLKEQWADELGINTLGYPVNGNDFDLVKFQPLFILNDNLGWTFKQIGAHLRAYPEVYFKESK